MSDERGRRADRPQERDAGQTPRGIEVLVRKAAVDAEFRTLLLDRRSEAAGAIGLRLSPAEAAMLNGIPAAQLEAVIAGTKVSPENRRTFLGRAAAAMLAALGVTACGIACATGTRPDRPEKKPKKTKSGQQDKTAKTKTDAKAKKEPSPRPEPGPTTGSRPDRP